jgi:hypothetical protein
MSELHERDVAQALGGRLTKGSGCTAQDATDVVSRGDDEFPWAADCKSTLAKSISTPVATWDKLVDQADGRMALLPLRCYGDARLTYSAMDLVAADLDDFAELMEWARAGKRAARVFGEVAPTLVASAHGARPTVALAALQRLAEALGTTLPAPGEG